jgi:hypothetical protein
MHLNSRDHSKTGSRTIEGMDQIPARALTTFEFGTPSGDNRPTETRAKEQFSKR